MVELSLGVFPDLKNHGIETLTHPADGTVLMREIGALVQVVRVEENLLHLLEADSTLGILPKFLALPRIEVEAHRGITVIPQNENKNRSAGLKTGLYRGRKGQSTGLKTGRYIKIHIKTNRGKLAR